MAGFQGSASPTWCWMLSLAGPGAHMSSRVGRYQLARRLTLKLLLLALLVQCYCGSVQEANSKKGLGRNVQSHHWTEPYTEGSQSKPTVHRRRTRKRSHYMQWIQQDLQLWSASGIPETLVSEAADRYPECYGEVVRLLVLNSTVWVNIVSGFSEWEQHKKVNWWPGKYGEAVTSGKAKIPYAILALMDTLRHHHGQIPDVDFVICTADFPAMPKSSDKHRTGVSPPLFAYNSRDSSADIPFPDYTYWGNEYDNMLDNNGSRLHGWDRQYAFLAAKYAGRSLSQRLPQAIWRGRTEDPEYPERDALRREFVDCPRKLQQAGRADDARLINVTGSKHFLHDVCDYRYPVYLECKAWVTNLKHKLSCGSVMLAPKMEYYEWFTRALLPNVHYVEIDEKNICNEVVDAVKQMNAAIEGRGSKDEAGEGARRHTAALSDAHEQLKQPWKVAQAAEQFIREHVQMEDVRMYIRDLLTEYANLLKFTPQPPYHAFCATGPWLLQQFVHAWDIEQVQSRYPWLETFQVASCKGKLSLREQAEGVACQRLPAIDM